MKKILFLVCLICGISAVSAQGFKAGFGVGYLSDIEGVGVSADLIYELDEKWGIANTTTFATAEVGKDNRLNWLTVDLNARYKVWEELYVLAGAEVLFQTFKTKKTIGGIITGDDIFRNTFFGGNIGAGYKIHLVSNVNLFGEVTYTVLDTDTDNSGYVHGRVGLVFDF